MVNFLDGLPQARAADALAAYSGPERLHLEADHLYVDYAEGVARSRLTPAFLDKAVQVPATATGTPPTTCWTWRGHSKSRPVRTYPCAAAAQAGLDPRDGT